MTCAVLVSEVISVWPNYIPFFNRPAGGARGGFSLLADSNLDWGQDLKLLAQWQQQHPGETLYLNYFGMAEPAFYGIRYSPLGVNADGRLVSDRPITTGVLAISATHLQGLYVSPAAANTFARIAQQPPDEILGGSIYLYTLR